MTKIRVGIVVPLLWESARAVTGIKIRPGFVEEIAEGVFLYCSGLGPENATQAARLLLERDVDALVSWGLAGALDPDLAAGSIVLPTHIVDHEDNRRCYPVDRRWYAALRDALRGEDIHSGGRIVSTRTVQADPRKKTALRQATQAVAVDMESAAIARMADEAGKPFAVIRTIFDAVTTHLPASALNATDAYGKVSIPKLCAGLLKRPTEIARYPALIRSWAKAEKGLRKVLARCGDDLCCNSLTKGS